jgi:hypothetical protein
MPTASVAPPTAENADEDKVCRSPVVALVVKMNVQAGQEQQTNDLIMVLEAATKSNSPERRLRWD